jgi:uncharacterized membrane protein
MGTFRRYFQILLTLVGLLALLFAIALFYPIQYLTPFVQDVVLANEYGRWAMLAALAFVALVILFVLLQALFAPGKRDNLLVKTETGELTFTKRSVEDTAIRSIQHLASVKFPTAKAKFGKSPEDTTIQVNFQVDEVADVINLANQVQSHIENAIETTMGVPVKDVDVKVTQLSQASIEAANQAKKAAAPRVQ